jgi:hypothetical protein
MATSPSNFTRPQTSIPANVAVVSGSRITSVIHPRAVAVRQLAPRPANLLVLPNEPEDARLTGGTRSLDRRLLALNLSGSLSKVGVAPERGVVPRGSAAA